MPAKRSQSQKRGHGVVSFTPPAMSGGVECIRRSPAFAILARPLHRLSDRWRSSAPEGGATTCEVHAFEDGADVLMQPESTGRLQPVTAPYPLAPRRRRTVRRGYRRRRTKLLPARRYHQPTVTPQASRPRSAYRRRSFPSCHHAHQRTARSSR